MHKSRIGERKKWLLLYRKVFVFIFTIFFLALVLLFFSRGSFSFVTVNIVGNNVISTEEINNVINGILKKKFLFYRKDNVVLFPWQEIKQALAEYFPRLEVISLRPVGLKTIILQIREREGKYLWCNESCYFIDDTGYIFAPSPYLSGNAIFRFYGDGDLGQFFLPEDIFEKVISFKDKLKNLGLNAVSFLKTAETYEFNLSGGSKIILAIDTDFGGAFDNLASAFSAEEFKNKMDTQFDLLEYLDLRFNNRVIYKFKP